MRPFKNVVFTGLFATALVGSLFAGCASDGAARVDSAAAPGPGSGPPALGTVKNEDPCPGKDPAVVVSCMSARASLWDAQHAGEVFVPIGVIDIPIPPLPKRPSEGLERLSQPWRGAAYVISNTYWIDRPGKEVAAWVGEVGSELAKARGLDAHHGVVMLVETPPGKAYPDSKETELLAPEGTTKLTIVNYKYPFIYMTDTNGKNVSLNLESLKFGSDKAPAGLKPVDLTPTGQ